MLRYLSIVALAGCLAHSGDEGMVVLNNTAITGNMCTLLGTAGQAFQTQGVISSLSPFAYVLTPFLQSKISVGDPTDVAQVLQRTIQLQGARVDLSVAGGKVSLPNNHFAALFSGDLPPQGTANVGFDLVPPEDIAAINSALGPATTPGSVTVIASAVVYGTMGGNEIDSNPFQYPVTVCNNCVVTDLGACKGLMAGTISVGNPCNPYQDGVLDCCEGTGLVCPAVPTM